VDGVFVDILKSGTYCWWKNAKTIAISKADMRVLTLEVAGQEILSKDKAQIRINFTLQYQIVDIVKALLDNKEYEKQLYSLMQLTLRSYIGQMTLDELMERKTEIQGYVLENTLPQVAGLGITLLTCGVKDVILPGDVRDIMNQVLIAEKRAQANSIMRREETASTRSLLNTAKLMEENSMLFKLKEMEYVEKIAEKINTISVSGNGQIVDQLKQLFVK
jgi:regulator of protease activity HflC (stomatin/prohibitin superfamily)